MRARAAIDGKLTTPDGESKPYTVPHALEEAELKTLIQDYCSAARNALEAGFDGAPRARTQSSLCLVLAGFHAPHGQRLTPCVWARQPSRRSASPGEAAARSRAPPASTRQRLRGPLRARFPLPRPACDAADVLEALFPLPLPCLWRG